LYKNGAIVKDGHNAVILELVNKVGRDTVAFFKRWNNNSFLTSFPISENINTETQISENQLIIKMEFHQGLKFHYYIPESLPLDLVMNQTNPFYTHTAYFLKIQFKMIL